MSAEGKRAQSRLSLWQRAVDFRAERLGSAISDLEERSARMLASADATRRGTRTRGLPLATAGFVLLGFLGSMVYQSVLAVNFTTGNSQIKIYSNYLDAQKAAAYLAPSSKASTPQVGVAELGIKTAKLAGFCAITTESLGVLGDYSLMITAGQDVPDTAAFTGTGVPAGVTTDATTGSLNGTSAAQAISANNLFLNSTAISGFGNLISGMNLGQSADTVAGSAQITWPGSASPTPGNFGLYTDRLNVAALGGQGYGLNLAGDITLPKLNLRVVQGAKTQNDCS